MIEGNNRGYSQGQGTGPTRLEIIRSGMQEQSNRKSAPSKNQMPNELLESEDYTTPSNQPISIADEIRKLATLKKEGIITEDEFKQMKQDLLRKFDTKFDEDDYNE